MLKKYFLRKLRQWVEKKGATKLVNAHKDVILEEYRRSLAEGATEETSVLAACRRMLTHII